MAEDCVGSTYSVLSTMPSDSESSSSLSSIGTGTSGKAASPPPTLMDTRQMSEKLEAIVYQLRQVTRERDELRKQLALSSPGSTFDDCRPSPKPSHDYERLKMQCMKAMSDLQSLQNQHTKTLKKCEEAVKEADFYHTLHSRLRIDQSQLKEDMEVIKRENSQLLREHNHAQQTCEELKRLHEEDQKEITDLRSQQQQVMRENGSSEILNKLYDTAMDKLEGLKKDYDTLRKRYNEKVANHNTDLSRLERVEEENRRFQKQNEMLMKQTDAAVVEKTSVQQQYLSTLKRYDSIQHELSKATVQNKELQREMERLQTEVTRYKTLQLKAVKDAEKYKEERDTVLNEYRLVMSERDQVHKEIDKLQTELELAQGHLKNTSSERKVAGEELEALRQKQDSATLDMERAGKEIEMLRKQCEAMSQELKEGIQEAEVAKRRRDWAFQERDKIVAERESIRTLCDNLRRERDRAVSDLAEALRDLDDMMKQKNDAVRELKELKEKMENQLEKEARIRQLMAHNSHDSAIDTDSLEWETEVVEFPKDRDDMDLKALGFDVAGGAEEPYLPGDSGIFVIKVDKGSIADGRLRVNDCLLRINDVDLTNKDRKHVIKAVLNGGGVINVVVRRRKSLGGRAITPVHISLVGHKDIGISLETGIYVATVSPGSSAAREGSLTVGDRLITINGIALENKSLTECEALLRNCRDSVSLSLMKVVPQSSSWSGQNILETLKESEKSGNCRVQESEVQVPNTRNLKHNSSTQTDIFITDSNILDDKNDRDHKDGSYCESKQFSSRSLQPNTYRTAEHTCCNYSELKVGPLSSEIYGIAEHEKRCFTFDPAVADCVVVDTDAEKGHSPKHNGGTWPKTMVDVSPEPGKLSIFKMPKQRKPVFDPDTFKRPQTPPKMDYLSPTQKQSHSSQSSKSESGSTPPTPPKRSDSFKFKHKQQTSSASDTAATSGSPPSSPAGPQSPVALGVKQDNTQEAHDRNAGHYQPTPFLEGSALIPSRISSEEEGNQRVEEVEPVNRRRPKSAPALRPSKLAPLTISGLSPQENVDPHSHYESHASCSSVPRYNTSEERLSLEPQEWHRYTPKRSQRQSGGYASTTYNCPTSGSAQRSFVPCPAVTAVLRNPNVPFFTVRSRMVHSANYPSMASQMCYPHPQHSSTRSHSPTESYNGSPRARHRPQSAICFPESVHTFDGFSPQHHAHHSLDLTGPDHKHSSDLSKSSRSTTPHGTQSLPASARIAGSSSSLAFAPSKSGRIRIPSNTRYPRLTTGSDRGSERSSPSLITPPQSPMNLETSSFGSSQSQSSISSLTKISISPVSTGEYRKDRYLFRNRSFLRIPLTPRPRFSSLRSLRPYLHEPRHVTVQKGAEPLGISIVSGENGGIFVSKVIGGSIAHQAGLEYGDQLLEYNGINLRNATEQQARLIIGQTEPCETITILAQYNPHMYQLGNHSRSSSRLDPISNHSTPHDSGATTPDNHSIIDAVSEQDEGTITPPSKQTTPTTSPRNSIRKSIDSTNQTFEPRFLFLKKTQMELGIQICGGNLYGVFVAKVEDDSPAKGPDGLVPGDKLLEYNGMDMRNVTAEQAYVEMLKPTESISVKAQYKIEEFNKIRDEAGDGFYIRALYDRVAEVEHDLSFKKDDILYVDDTLPQGNFGYWMAWQLDENAQKLERGHIPSKYMMDQEFCRRHSMSEVKDENGSVKTLSAAARRSFFRRKQKHKRNNSKDGKEMLALDAISTDSIPLLEDSGSLAYQRVQKIECTSPRPVLILGPLVDVVKDMLVKDSAGKFCRCPLEVMKASQQAIERGVADYLFIDYKRRSGHFDVTTVASIKEITEKDCHCLLDIAPHAIERLHRIHIYPIVIFIRYKNLKQIKEQKDPIFLRDKGTQKKHSKEQFEAAQKIEQEYSKFFTGIVQGGSLPYICTQIMTIVDQEQSKVLWIPAGTL
ncbi:disks large homolog 5a isoform X6 [Pristis pectinata]|uniref:disks large homolog 5a isoform X6 n=1 Tax=Pristis pectinata TaxID=685728 RepID=UPI00223CCD00|nr:disks large homolog 5a isoform X6 [Pristis pectinata]